jgi:hypothetical protein
VGEGRKEKQGKGGVAIGKVLPYSLLLRKKEAHQGKCFLTCGRDFSGVAGAGRHMLQHNPASSHLYTVELWLGKENTPQPADLENSPPPKTRGRKSTWEVFLSSLITKCFPICLDQRADCS